ncbi:MAG: hypothetical protein HQM00_03975 [Magnetococcales bacterium]|nr:hypothetical protein [Magnetococcales bacterium]
MDAREPTCRLPCKLFALALCALAITVWSAPGESAATGNVVTVSVVGATGSVNGKKVVGKGADHIYYPDVARSFYDYQNTGAFAGRPMVIPPTVPIITQPAYYYTTAPTPEVVLAPLPTFKASKPSVSENDRVMPVTRD